MTTYWVLALFTVYLTLNLSPWWISSLYLIPSDVDGQTAVKRLHPALVPSGLQEGQSGPSFSGYDPGSIYAGLLGT